MSRDDDIAQCECGSTTYTIARDGLIECSDCGHPADSVIAIPADVHAVIRARGLTVIDPEAMAH